MEAKFLHSFFKKSTFSTEYIWRQFEFCHSSVYNNLITYSFFREASSWNRIFSVIIGPCLKGNTCHVWKPNFHILCYCRFYLLKFLPLVSQLLFFTSVLLFGEFNYMLIKLLLNGTLLFWKKRIFCSFIPKAVLDNA